MHISAASLWIGALATMAGLLWFGAPQLRRAAFMRFSRLATVLIVLVLAAGIYLAIVRLPHLHDLWSTSYGQVLLVKIGLVCVALLWGAFHHFVVRPALDRADDGFLSRIGRSLVGESLVGIAVLLVAAVLVDSRPPPRPIGTSPTSAAAGGSAATLRLRRNDRREAHRGRDRRVLAGRPTEARRRRADLRARLERRQRLGRRPRQRRRPAHRPGDREGARPRLDRARVFNLAAAPGAVWAIANLDETAARIDTRTGKVTERFRSATGRTTSSGASAPPGCRTRSTARSRGSRTKVVKTIKVGVEPNGLAAIGGYLWVTDHTAGKLLRHRPADEPGHRQVPLSGADWVTGLGLVLYVSQETNVVTRVDARTLKVPGRGKVHRNPLGSAIVSGDLWVPCIDANDDRRGRPGDDEGGRRAAAGPARSSCCPRPGHVGVAHDGDRNLAFVDLRVVDLTDYRDRFPILESTTYLINHSLGAMPAEAERRLQQFAREWATRGARAWGEGWWNSVFTTAI